MSNFITISEVISQAFNRSIEDGKILDNDITAAEWKYIKPILTDDLWDDAKANPSSYVDLIEKIKPCLSYYIKYEIMPELSMTISDRGSFIQTAGDSQPMTDEQRRVLRDSVLEKANSLAEMLSDYIATAELVEYERTDNLKPQIIGGILVYKKIGE